MHLGPEQTAAFVRQVLAEGTYVICHQTLTYGDNPGFGPAICRGFFDAYANSRELHQRGEVWPVWRLSRWSRLICPAFSGQRIDG
jgi:hypothetical protein